MSRRVKWLALILSCVLLIPEDGLGQQNRIEEESRIVQEIEAGSLDDGDFSFWESVVTFLFPRGVKDTWRLRRYLRSEQFTSVRERVGDLRAIDFIFARALKISHDDASEALFICTLATMEHRKVGIRLPIIKLPIYLPLTSEGDSAFQSRVTHLPSHFYSDSPHGGYGDRDKLQHFFGSAFIAYSFRSRSVANFFGDFVEWGEEEFIIDGASDARDRRANHQGQEFGLALGDHPHVSPSDFIQIQLVLTGSRMDW